MIVVFLFLGGMDAFGHVSLCHSFFSRRTALCCRDSSLLISHSHHSLLRATLLIILVIVVRHVQFWSRPYPSSIYTNDTGPTERMYDVFVINTVPEQYAQWLKTVWNGGRNKQQTPVNSPTAAGAAAAAAAAKPAGEERKSN